MAAHNRIELLKTIDQRRVAFKEAIEAELRDRWQRPVEYAPEWSSWRVNDIVAFSINEERSHTGSWHSKPNGRLRVTVGSYTGRKQFPEPNAGFDIPKIAAAVVKFVDATRERELHNAEQRLREKKATEVASRVYAESVPAGFQRVRVVPQTPDLVRVELTALNPDEAKRVIADFVKATGASA